MKSVNKEVKPERVLIHKGWEGVNSPDSPPTKMHSPAFTALILLCVAMLVMLWFANPSNAAEECLDGTWVYESNMDAYGTDTGGFVCVKDDGVYTPPTD